MKYPRKFKHPSGNGYTETVGLANMIPIVLFGSFYFLFKAMWFWALIAWPIVMISGLVAASAVASIFNLWVGLGAYIILTIIAARGCLEFLAERYLKRGWHEVTSASSFQAVD